jgi:glycerol-3-phosphate dehydrogenase (NAD(P)+)
LLKGSGYQDNSISAFITQGLSEIASLIKVLNGQTDTAYGLAGLGDLILTSLGKHSKNMKAGMLIAQGYTLDQIKTELPTLPEGINSIKSVHDISSQKNLSLPLLNTVYAIIHKQEDPQKLIHALMS